MSPIKVVCACGETFERIPQRGRPAVWCTSCREIPMNRRLQLAKNFTPVETGSSVDVVEQVEEPVVGCYGEHDVLTPAQRAQVEANVAEANRIYVEEIVPNKETLFPNMSDMDRSTACIQWHFKAMTEAYTKVTPKWWSKNA